METRQLQRTGKTSFTVTLPKKWVETSGLSDKSPVNIYLQSSGSLLIRPQIKSDTPIKVQLDGHSKKPDWIARELIALYLSGADEIAINQTRILPQMRDTIRQTSQYLIGLEIIEESSSSLVMRNIFDTAKFPVPQNLQKMFVIARSMLTDAIGALTRSNTLLARDVIDRDIEVDKLHFVIMRQFNSLLRGRFDESQLGLSLPSANYYSTIALQVERVADHAVKIAQMRLGLDGPLSKIELKQLIDSSKTVVAFLRLAEDMVYALERETAQDILDRLPRLDLQLRTARLTPPLAIVADSLSRTCRYVLNIAEITLDQSIADGPLI